MNKVVQELKHHVPYTALGAIAGILFMVLFRDINRETAHELFYVFHPLHVLLSALATTSLFRLHTCLAKSGKPCNLPLLVIVGLVGSIGIATISDSIMPYLGEILINMPHRHYHVGFIEKWWLIMGVAIVGIVIAYFNPSTKFPHAGHVFISTWASIFHIFMAKGDVIPSKMYLAIFCFLFLAVWVPCCFSDIVFPLLFVKKGT